MKKYLLLVLGCLLIVTGCGKDDTKKAEGKSGSLVCTKTTEEDGVKSVENVTVNYKNDKVTTVQEEMIETVGKDGQELAYNTFKGIFENTFKDIEGLEVKVEKEGKDAVKIIMDMDYSKIDPENLKKALGDENDEEIKTDITIDDFKKEELDGYTCK